MQPLVGLEIFTTNFLKIKKKINFYTILKGIILLFIKQLLNKIVFEPVFFE